MTDDDIRAMTNLEFHLWLYENRKGDLSINNRSPIEDVGINDAPYIIFYRTLDKTEIVCPCYQAWCSIFERCYNEKRQKTYQNYIGITIHPDWIYFSHFREWWVKNYIEGCAIDKDILYHPLKHGPNKIYGPDTCVYIPGWLNSFATTRTTGQYGRGVGKIKNKGNYYVKSYNPFTKIRIRIPSIKTADEAYVIYLKTKLSIIKSMKKDLDKIHPDLYIGLIRFIMSQPRF